MKIDAAALDDLSLGATFLATGGGGDPYTSLLLTRLALERHGPVELLAADDLDDDACVVAIGGVGAPTVSLELLPSMRDAADTLRAFEAHVGRPVDAVVSFEIGGGNSLIPIMAAAGRGLPVVDGDGMGRALPEAQMMTYPIAGVAPTPAVALDYAGQVVSFSARSTLEYERQIRAMAMARGGMVTAAEHPMSGRQLKASVVPGTVTLSMKIGRVLREKRGSAPGIMTPLREAFAGSIYGRVFHLFSGKVVDHTSAIVGGFDVGMATIEAFDDAAEVLSIAIRNEYLVARIGDRVVASVPDLIIVIDYETSSPVNAERLRYGQRVTVLGIGCPDYYRGAAALAVVSPRSFGFDFDYVPIEQLR